MRPTFRQLKNVVCWSMLLVCCIMGTLPLHASDEEAMALYDEGRQLYLKADYHAATEKFDKCYQLAHSSTIRANSLLAKIGACRMCKLYYREFQAIELLLDKYMEFGNYREMVEREFAIGNAYNNGYREPAFWSFRWAPWLNGADHTEEIYSKALKRSPFAPGAPAALLQLAYWYEMEGMTYKSLDTLRTLVRNHPAAPECKYALLALGNGLYELARRGGDGDGSKVEEAKKCLMEFERRYPDAPELDFARRTKAASRDVQAENLNQMAEFYRKSGRTEVANRYLAKLVQHFPDTVTAAEAEKKLAELDNTFLPGDFPETNHEPRLPDLHAYKMPEPAELELISPLAPRSHFLLPVPDIKGELNQKYSNEGSK